MPAQPPDEVFIGMVPHEWPLRIFASEAHASGWLNETGAPQGLAGRRLFRVQIVDAVEYEPVPPVPASIRPRGA